MFGILFLLILLGLIAGLGLGVASLGRYLGRRSLGSSEDTDHPIGGGPQH